MQRQAADRVDDWWSDLFGIGRDEVWRESGVSDDYAEIGFGIVEDGELVAAATLSSWDGRPSDIGVLAAPARRVNPRGSWRASSSGAWLRTP